MELIYSIAKITRAPSRVDYFDGVASTERLLACLSAQLDDSASLGGIS